MLGRTAVVAALILSVCMHSVAVAYVIYTGADTTTNDAWRTTDSAKPLDPDGDNAYGTDGYETTPWATSSLPAYASVTRLLPYTETNPTAADADDPAYLGPAPIPDISTGRVYTWATTPGIDYNVFQVDLLQDATFMLGVITDTWANNPEIHPANVQVRQTIGGSDSVSSGAMGDRDGDVDYYLFELGGSTGDRFIVFGTAATTAIGLGGLTFDTVPEPGSIVLFGLGAVGLALYWRKRK